MQISGIRFVWRGISSPICFSAASPVSMIDVVCVQNKYDVMVVVGKSNVHAVVVFALLELSMSRYQEAMPD
jgi:hypothetical protein